LVRVARATRIHQHYFPSAGSPARERRAGRALSRKRNAHSSSVFINDDERGLHADLETWLEALAPEKPHAQYRHNDTGEDNADAHLKRTVMGREVVVAITNGSSILVLGNRFSTASLTDSGRSASW
jgi:hypothetical protein